MNRLHSRMIIFIFPEAVKAWNYSLPKGLFNKTTRAFFAYQSALTMLFCNRYECYNKRRLRRLHKDCRTILDEIMK